jgi:hypothetical protein
VLGNLPVYFLDALVTARMDPAAAQRARSANHEIGHQKLFE